MYFSLLYITELSLEIKLVAVHQFLIFIYRVHVYVDSKLSPSFAWVATSSLTMEVFQYRSGVGYK